MINNATYKPKVLIVDDVPANLKVLSDILRDEGYKIRPVTSGIQALQVAEKVLPDVVLLDIMMPEMDGIETCKLLKANPVLADIPVIFISALSESESIVNALNVGGVDYITKPFKIEEVKARVSTHIKINLQRKELEELISVRNKFVSVLAHDLRNSVQVFLGMSEILSDDLNAFPPDETKEILKDMNKSAKNINHTLENLLEWSNLQSKKIAFNPERTNIFELTNDLLKSLSQSTIAKNLSVLNNIDPSIFLSVDKYMLSSVFRNLLLNAIKYSKENGKIIIGSKLGDSENTFFVQDFGQGISDELLNTLLTLKTKITLKNEGEEFYSGLGLLMCKEFIEYHNGKIWIESKHGEGCTVYFTI
ncbi:MAG TPA: hybrid sensor histidine kinase/response regulator [Melioribacteraceae bacterium]|nr:hybrid sensor histidine kinase/response regulator [Melioribacteraceae bacterium]